MGEIVTFLGIEIKVLFVLQNLDKFYIMDI